MKVQAKSARIPSHKGGAVAGVVVHGDKRGRLLGFPTANIEAEGVAIQDGVWAGTVQIAELSGKSVVAAAAISLGRRPTYYAENGIRLIEAHLLDFDGDIYGRTVEVGFDVFLRGQVEFRDSSELVRQLHADVAATRTWAIRTGLLRARSAPAKDRRSGRWGPTRRARKVDMLQRRADREQRRPELVSQAVLSSPDPATITHAWVASWTGLNIAYLRHRFPTIDHLRRAAPIR